MKNTQFFTLILLSSFLLSACRIAENRPGIVPTARAERQGDTETIDESNASEEFLTIETTEANFENGVNGLFIGHSFFVPVAKAFDLIASRSDYPDHQAAFVFSGGASGSPRRMWEDEKDKEKIEAILANGDIDLLGMTIATTPDDGKALGGYLQWIDLALTYNPNTSFFIGQVWVPRGPSMDDQKYAELTEQGAQRNFEIVQELRAIYPGTQIYFINYGKIASDMKIAFSAGELPDIELLVGKNETSLFVDDKIGHGGRLMHELCALTWVSILYEAEIEEVAHSDFSAEAMQILEDSIQHNGQFK